MSSIIDFHTHIFPDTLAPRAIARLLAGAPNDRNFTDGTASGLLQSMQQHSIALSVTLPIATKKEQVSTIIKQQAMLDRNFFIPFGTIHPATKDIDTTIKMVIDNHLSGIKLHPEYQQFHLDDRTYFPLYDALSASGLVIVIHAGKDPGPFPGDHALPEAFVHVRKNFPKLKMVAAHMGGWKLWEQIPEKLCDVPMYFDTSAVYGFLCKDLFMRIATRHGIDNILFGSDSPWFDQGSAVQWIDSLPLSHHAKEKIFGLNAVTLLSS